MTPADKFLIVALLFLSLISYTLIRSMFPVLSEGTAVVEVEEREVMRLSLNPNLPSRKISLKLNRGEATLHISGGKIRMQPMPDELCPKHICSKRGWIEKPWEMIVCMPNRVSIRISGARERGDVDLITK